MVFSSNLFLFAFLPITLGLYYLVKNHRWQNFILVLMSTLFYAWGAPRFLAIFFISLFVNYFLVIAIERNQVQTRRKLLLYIAVLFNLAILVYFKYTNFMIADFNRLFMLFGLKGIIWPTIFLPIGISFFTFHKISYVVDVYRRRQKGFTNLLDYNLYLLFFPQLIAGPIIRYHEIADQIRERRHTREMFLEGIWRFSLGLSKKVIIADTLGYMVDQVFRINLAHLGSVTAWFGILCYAFQLFFDFSGYSDMAIGLGKMFGFNLPENFNRPYLARSLTEFWRRWHMSLTRFFRDYVYIPMGIPGRGKRVSYGRQLFNLWFVFLLVGFWHGANWTFLAYGVYIGSILVFEKVFLLKRLEKLPAVLSTMYTFVVCLIAMVIFRSPGMRFVLGFWKAMFTWHSSHVLFNGITVNIQVWLALAVAVLISFVPVNKESKFVVRWENSLLLRSSLGIMLLGCSMIVMSCSSFSPFIYFQF